MAKAYGSDELALRTFWLSMAAIGGFIAIVFLFIL